MIGCAGGMTPVTQPHTIRAPRGTTLSCKGWQQEAALRMLMNNLDPEVAEHPEDLVVYGGTGRAAQLARSTRSSQRCRTSRTTKRYWSSPASRSASSVRTSGRPGF